MSTAFGVAGLLAALLIGWWQLSDLREVRARGTRSPEAPEETDAEADAETDAGTDAETGRTVDVSVVIPARNEATRLPALLASLQALTTRPAEIVVVDDHSDDDTADIARTGGAKVLTATDLPPGWTGKAWACQQGAEATSGSMLMFLDADTVLAPDALQGLLELHAEHGGLVSVQPYHRVEKAYEQLSCYFNVVSLMGSGAFSRRPSRRPMAFGPCLVTSRADYHRAGGHAVVRAEILDDARLATAYARAGLPVRCVIGGRALSMRMYPGGPRQLAEGWTKNIASGAGQADPRSSAAAAVWVASHCAVAAGAVSALAGLPMSWGTPVLWAVGWIAAAVQFKLFLRRIGSFRWWTWIAFPVPLVAFGVLFARSLILTQVRRSVRWRGRSIGVPGLRPSRAGREDG